MLTTARTFSQMSSLKLGLTAFSIPGSRSDIGPMPSFGPGPLMALPWTGVFSSGELVTEMPRVRPEDVLGGVPGKNTLPPCMTALMRCGKKRVAYPRVEGQYSRKNCSDVVATSVKTVPGGKTNTCSGVAGVYSSSAPDMNLRFLGWCSSIVAVTVSSRSPPISGGLRSVRSCSRALLSPERMASSEVSGRASLESTVVKRAFS